MRADHCQYSVSEIRYHAVYLLLWVVTVRKLVDTGVVTTVGVEEGLVGVAATVGVLEVGVVALSFRTGAVGALIELFVGVC